MKITRLEEYLCEGEIAVIPELCNQLGCLHGGCIATLADTVTGIAACSNGNGAVTVDCNIHYLRPAKGSVIRCRASAEKVGKRLSVFRCELTDDAGSLVASGLFTFMLTEPFQFNASE